MLKVRKTVTYANLKSFSQLPITANYELTTELIKYVSVNNKLYLVSVRNFQFFIFLLPNDRKIIQLSHSA